VRVLLLFLATLLRADSSKDSKAKHNAANGFLQLPKVTGSDELSRSAAVELCN
jgi:hypothetical protein